MGVARHPRYRASALGARPSAGLRRLGRQRTPSIAVVREDADPPATEDHELILSVAIEIADALDRVARPVVPGTRPVAVAQQIPVDTRIRTALSASALAMTPSPIATRVCSVAVTMNGRARAGWMNSATASTARQAIAIRCHKRVRMLSVRRVRNPCQ